MSPKERREREDANRASWHALTEHVAHGERAAEILEEVYLGGPKRIEKDHVLIEIPEKTWHAIQAFFHFDDSE